MKIPQRILNCIETELDAVKIVSPYVKLRKKGSLHWGLCPFHKEKTPSFAVNQKGRAFYCFGCQKGGSMFSFIMAIEKVPFEEAVRKLAVQAKIESLQ